MESSSIDPARNHSLLRWARSARWALCVGLLFGASSADAATRFGPPPSGCLDGTSRFLEQSVSQAADATLYGVPALAQRLALTPGQAELVPFSSIGGMNEVYSIEGRGPGPQAVFPRSPMLPRGLWGRPLSEFLAKQTKSTVDAPVSRRNTVAHAALVDELARGGARYEGIALAETYLLGAAVDGSEVIVQKKVGGQALDAFLTPLIAKAMGDPSLKPSRALELFRVFQEREAKGHSPSEIFVAQSFAPIDRSAEGMGRPAILAPSEAQLRALRDLWREPDLVRIRELMARLRALDRSEGMVRANAELKGLGRPLFNRMPWSTQLQPVNGDFSARNFHLERGADGRLGLKLFDY